MFPTKTHLEAKSGRVFWNHNCVLVEISLEFHKYVLSLLHGISVVGLLQKPCWCSNWTPRPLITSETFQQLQDKFDFGIWKKFTNLTLICQRRMCSLFFWFNKNFVFPLFNGMICGSMEDAKTNFFHYVLSHNCWKYSNWGY